ncbi:protein DEPP-like [Arapaima gigas]
MRPRSRLLVKKRLPTIREGSEEMLQDMNQVNSCHSPNPGHPEALSSEAYLQSICQLAQPAFPLREPDRDILALGSLDLNGLRPGAPNLSVAPVARRYTHTDGQPGHSPNTRSLSDAGAPDPLEYLYGHQTGPSQDAIGKLPLPPRQGGAPTETRSLVRANSFPHLSSPRHTQRKSSCPELSLRDTCGLASSSTEPRRPPLPASSAHAGGREKCGTSMDRQSVISHWMADCRSAWREARMRSCMLPAIAEI